MTRSSKKYTKPIKQYIKSSDELNGALRSAGNGNNDDDTKLRDKCNLLVQALAKLSNYQGTVYRGCNYPPEVIQNFCLQDMFVDKAFLSTSKASFVEQKHNRYKHLQCLLTIQSETGKDISHFAKKSSYSDEEEVLFAPETKFRIVSFAKKGTGLDMKYIIELEEIEKSPMLWSSSN